MKLKNPAGRIDSVSIIAWVTMVLLAIPIFYILVYGFLVYGSAIAQQGALIRSIELTIISSAISAVIVFMIFTPLAFDLSRRQNSFLESATDIPASIPHPIVGIAFLILASPITPFGSFLYSIGIDLYNSILGLIVVLSFVSAPVYIRSAQSVFSAMNRHHEMLGYSLGSSRLSVLYSVVVPSNLKDLVSAVLTAMSRAMSEFGSVAILTYYIASGPFSSVEPASVLIWNDFQTRGPAVAVPEAAIMIVISLLLLVIIRVVKSGILSREGKVR